MHRCHLINLIFFFFNNSLRALTSSHRFHLSQRIPPPAYPPAQRSLTSVLYPYTTVHRHSPRKPLASFDRTRPAQRAVLAWRRAPAVAHLLSRKLSNGSTRTKIKLGKKKSKKFPCRINQKLLTSDKNTSSVLVTYGNTTLTRNLSITCSSEQKVDKQFKHLTTVKNSSNIQKIEKYWE